MSELNGLVCRNVKINEVEKKREAEQKLWGWDLESHTPEDWLEIVDQGFTVLVADMQPNADNTYSHRKALWVSSKMIGLDFDRFEYTDTDGTKYEGYPPYQKASTFWEEHQEKLEKDFYALGRSVSCFRKGDPPHLRIRAWVLLETAISTEEMYNDFLRGMAHIYPMCSEDLRSPAQPVFGNATLQSEIEDGKVVESKKRSTTHIVGAVMSEDRMREVIETGMFLRPEPTTSLTMEKVVNTESTPRNKKTGVKDLDTTVKKQATVEIPPIEALGQDLDFATQYLESKGSTFLRDASDARHFTRAGKDDGTSETLSIKGGAVIFYAFSHNSYFVTEGYAEHRKGISFADLWGNVEMPGATWSEINYKVATEYPQYDTGWRPNSRAADDLKPLYAMNLMPDVVEQYLAANSEDMEVSWRQIAPGWDERIVVSLEGKEAFFSVYWAWAEGFYEIYRIVDTDYDNTDPEHRGYWRLLNNEAAKITGNTGGWNQRTRNDKYRVM